MGGKSNAAPVIIKRKKVVAGGGHHGGAWKVAYADFVTAMMAFFLLMWLLGATTEKQRKGVADYFRPTVSLTRESGGGENVLYGESSMPSDTMAKSGSGVDGGRQTDKGDTAAEAELHEAKSDIDKALTAFGGESMTMQQALRHVVSRVTDEGLVIEVFDIEGLPLFTPETTDPAPALYDISRMLAEVLGIARNDIAVNGHVRAYPAPLARNPAWDLSAARADRMRLLLEQSGLPAARIARIEGHADRRPVTADPMAIRNNRIEIILLRKDR